MQLIPKRQSKRQRAVRAATKGAKKAGKTAVKVKMVQRAPKAAAAIWAARRSGGVMRAAAIGTIGVVTLRALRKRGQGAAEGTGAPAPAGPSESYRTTPTPQSSQQTGGEAPKLVPATPTKAEETKLETLAGGPPNESAPGSDIPAPPESESITPPHGDPMAPDKVDPDKAP
jgi:hypothetical protein